jgi:hypothetical protein
MAYVYQHIRLDTNEVFYIGIGSDTEGKYKRANSNKKRNPHWHNVINKAGYKIEILLDNINWKEACNEENRLIKLYGRKDINKGTLVNMTNGGDGVLGLVWNEEMRLKASDRNKGKIISEETRLKLRNRVVSEETKQKISEAHKGRIVSEETKLKMSKPCSLEKAQKISKALKGKIVSEETKLKMSEVRKGKPLSEEIRKKMLGERHTKESKQKIRDFQKGRIKSEETRLKLSEAHKGKSKKPFSEEHRRKMSEAQILYNKNKKLNTIPPKPHQFF